MDLAGPKLRVGPMEAGPEVIKVRPERDVTGTVLKPARIWLVPQAHTGAIVGGAESTPIPVAAGDLASLRTGDQIEFTDARGSSRRMVLAAMRRPAAGVMIARGDLAVECGYERMAEIQEEILWVCEAAHMPVVWATQVLESLAKTGVPSRAEITDAAMGERAECVMLNKGPHLCDAVEALDDILQRMQDHQVKKSAMLRKLKRW